MIKFQACKREFVDIVMIESGQDMLASMQDDIEFKVKVFNLLGNDVRLKIILLLLNIKKVCVCDIADILKMNQSPISQHLRKLKDSGLLQSKREGMTIFYSICDEKKELLEKILKG